MKSFGDFKVKKVEPPVEIQEESLLEAVDYEDIRGVLVEAKESDPPAVLVLRRKTIRQIGNKQKVALYFADKINKYVTISYGSGGHLSATIGEDVEELSYDLITELKDIVENNCKKSIMLEDGNWKNVSVHTAMSILEVYDNHLTKENKQLFAEMAIKSVADFNRVVDFVNKNLK
jgi:hypothetical protein